MAKKVNYLSNKNLLTAIHKCKMTFCDYDNKEDTVYDISLTSKDDIVKRDIIEKAKENRAKRLSKELHTDAVNEHTGPDKDKPKAANYKIDPNNIKYTDLVFRVLTYEHIPLALGRKKNPKITADYHEYLNFKPFKHYRLVFPEGVDQEEAIDRGLVDVKTVLVSHYKNGKYNPKGGQITDELARIYLLLVERYSKRPNWNNYTYLDEMKSSALVTLTAMGLLFEESNWENPNPFAYFTKIIEHSFIKVFNAEKKQQTIRDDLLEHAGQNPSFTRQIENEEEARLHLDYDVYKDYE